MDSDNLNWERDKWGNCRGKGYFSKSSIKRQNVNNHGNSFYSGKNEEVDNWRSSSRGVSQSRSSSKYQFNDDEEFWSRGGEVIFLTAENLIAKMAEDDYSGNISKELLEPKLKIVDFLNNDKRFTVNHSQNLMKIILKDSEENLFEKHFRTFLILVQGTNFSTKRIDSLINIDLVLNPTMELLNLIVRFLKLFFEILPGLVYDTFYPRVKNIQLLLSANQLKMEVSGDVVGELDELEMLATNSQHVRCDNINNSLSDCLLPPNDFRAMTILPTRSDLFENENRNIFLRENKYLGAYRSVNHYLDVQFRLMREDFVRPLREGVRTFKNNTNKSFDIRVYKNVSLIDAIPDRKLGIIYNIQLDQSRLTHIKWSESKRFMNGSLLCFSCDNFETFLLAIVAKRLEENIVQGILSVKFVDIVPEDYKEYTLLESTTLFESYRHVLLRLQNVDEDNLCMKDYLVYGRKEISPPAYLTANTDLEYEFKGQVIRPSRPDEERPDAVHFKMNKSQHEAFRMALTKEIAIIQGPPGTGKTYVGLEICRCLLENVQSRLENFGPILVVCYTNHALDQFLTGISAFTQKIVRIGGGCKSDHIKKFNILDTKRRMEHPIVTELQNLETELEYRRTAFRKLIKLDELRNVISKEYCNYFTVLRIENWLIGESIDEEIGYLEIVLNRMVEKIISEEIYRNLANIVNEACTDCGSLNFVDGGDSDDDGFTIVLNGFKRVKDRTTKKLFNYQLNRQVNMSAKEAANVTSLDNLSLTNRWRLFRYWRSLYVTFLKQTTKYKEDEYDILSKRYNDIVLENDEDLMLDQAIIGLTTTGAAKYGKILERIGCKIIIVEEAAEVIESHIIGSLNSYCQHLILIGDHKQLRPNPAVYELAKHYGLDLSLFERLINNGIGYTTLSTQHRMRPEISDIVRFIYNDLQDHESVLRYPDVPTVRSNVFFFSHFEREQSNEDILSYSNRFEADFLIGFCRHLLHNGVCGKRITILTLYSGQHYLIKSLINGTEFEHVRVSVVDNFQGEENDIILLSLVRSNEYEQIGFLNIENRICVSLSRAKHGLYVFGNFDILSAKNRMWEKICDFLKTKHLLGKSIDMYCQNHLDKRLSIRTPDDFKKYPDFGCEELCLAVLQCGHICPRFCHYLDRDHLEQKCMENCKTRCVYGHRCQKWCYERCGNCIVQTEKVIPGCNHRQMVSCYKLPSNSDCKNPCERILPCGHPCTKLCSENCSPCLSNVDKTSLRCSHSGKYPCHVQSIVCNETCDYLLKCGHLCKDVCGVCWQTQRHSICNEDCSSLLICGHNFRAKYSIYNFPCIKEIEDPCYHFPNSVRCSDYCSVCTGACVWQCRHERCTRSCKDMCDRNLCNERCKLSLSCKNCYRHFNCYGICGENCRQICPECDPDIKDGKMYITLWTCEHTFEVDYLDGYMFDVTGDCEIARKTCPLCGVTLNLLSSCRYMNVIRENWQIIDDVRKLITARIDSFEYSSYYKILHRLKDYIFLLFSHYSVINYLIITIDLDKNTTKEVDLLYYLCFNSNSRLNHVAVYKYRCCIVLLYVIYVGIYIRDESACNEERYIATATLVEWLNPHNRRFDDLDMEIFLEEYFKIKNEITEDRVTKPIVAYKAIENEPEILLNDCDSEPDDVVIWRRNVSFTKPSEDFHGYLDNVFIDGYATMRGFRCHDKRWFRCFRGHIYNYGECLQLAAQCPECNPSRLWLKIKITGRF